MSSSSMASSSVTISPPPVSSSVSMSPTKVLGPYLINSTITCFNTSLLPDWDKSQLLDPDLYHHELHQAAVPCPIQMDNDLMVDSLVHFWNLAFTFMIITAVVGNTAVLWIVIRKKSDLIFIYSCQLYILQTTEG